MSVLFCSVFISVYIIISYLLIWWGLHLTRSEAGDHITIWIPARTPTHRHLHLHTTSTRTTWSSTLYSVLYSYITKMSTHYQNITTTNTTRTHHEHITSTVTTPTHDERACIHKQLNMWIWFLKKYILKVAHVSCIIRSPCSNKIKSEKSNISCALNPESLSFLQSNARHRHRLCSQYIEPMPREHLRAATRRRQVHRQQLPPVPEPDGQDALLHHQARIKAGADCVRHVAQDARALRAGRVRVRHVQDHLGLGARGVPRHHRESVVQGRGGGQRDESVFTRDTSQGIKKLRTWCIYVCVRIGVRLASKCGRVGMRAMEWKWIIEVILKVCT